MEKVCCITLLILNFRETLWISIFDFLRDREIAPKYLFFQLLSLLFSSESRAYLLNLPVRYPSWIGRSLFRTCTGLPIGRLGTTGAAVTKRHLG